MLSGKADDTLSQRSIELLIGRLVTDEAFRISFLKDPAVTLGEFIESGHELTAVEIQALAASSPLFWREVAERLDPRLQKVTLK
jgi:hypothetical protein